MQPPLVSVVMPVFDNEQYLSIAIESVLNQTLKDFEFLVISEYGTSQESLEIISQYKDPRIRHIHNSERLGLAQSLNRGIAQASGRYIARFDADDINLPTRFEKQVNFLNAHSEVGVLGARYDMVDKDGRVLLTPKPTTEINLIRWRMYFGECAVAHPTVMVRSDIYRQLGGYDPKALVSEDFELWTRALEITEITNLPDILLRLRVHTRSASHVHETEGLARTLFITRSKLTEKFGEQVPQRYLDVIMLHRVREAEEAFDASLWMVNHCQNYLTSQNIPNKGTRAIRAFTAEKLYPVALICLRKRLLTSMKIWRLIFELDPIGSRRFMLDLSTRIVKHTLKSVLRPSGSQTAQNCPVVKDSQNIFF